MNVHETQPGFPGQNCIRLAKGVLTRFCQRWRIGVAGLVLLAVVSGWYIWNYRDPTYDFRVEGFKDPQQIIELARLACELREVGDWKPPYFWAFA